ncbi:hypothetical protein [Absidia glauca]|uniref:Ndc10 domain-containing protein n=1 Tax=Absidia glauca TaxID=4829 RepID=A0A168SZA0_ABSGL|nr:hypothetical protein [Absidia glauca]
MNNAYLTSLSRIDAINGRSLYPARVAIDAPTSLCKTLFPAIDEWHDRLGAKEPSLTSNDPIQSPVAANAL